MRRAKISNITKNSAHAFYPYQLEDGQRADTIAWKYYNDPYTAWLVYFSNDVVDPYYDWNLDQSAFDDYIVDKYGSIANAQFRIAEYGVNWYGDDRKIAVAAYDALQPIEKKYWQQETNSFGNVVAYKRKELDWRVNTNRVVSLDITGNNALEIGDQVQFKLGNTIYANAEVAFSSNTNIDVIKISGDTRRLAKYTISSNTGAFTVGESVTPKYANNLAITEINTPTVVATTNTTITLTFDGSLATANIGVITGVNSAANAAVSISEYTQLHNKGNTDIYVVVTDSEQRTMVDSEGETIYIGISDDELAYWEAISYYDNEEEENAKKNSIRLLDVNLLTSANKQLATILKE